MAYAMAGVYGDLNEVGRGGECTQGLRAAGEGERTGAVLHIEGNYYLDATGELEKAAQTFELWQQTYPRDAFGLTGTSGMYVSAAWKLGKGIGGSPRGAAPGAKYWGQLYQPRLRYMALNRLDEAEAVYKQAEERKLENEFCSRTATSWRF
jgi:hypothetical protein